MNKRNHKKYLVICLAVMLLGFKSYAQELNCSVSVLAPTIQLTNKDVFKNMEIQIKDFMNNRHWTNDNVSAVERIDCQLQITINSYNGNDYSGTIQVLSGRPVYGTNYISPMFNFLDKSFNVKYVQFQALEYQENTYINELTSVLAYYAYIILGYDYDSFSKLGGQPYFLKAQSIVSSAPTSTTTGWSALDKDDHNRYFLINDLMDERFKPLREAIYNYHRLGLDYMSEDNEKGLNKILESVEAITELKKSSLSYFVTSLFFSAKSNELVDIFAQAPTDKKNKARELLVVGDALNAEKYTDKLK